MRKIILNIVMLAITSILTAQGTQGLSYKLINNNTAYEVSKGNATNRQIVIQASYNGRPVTHIAAGAFHSHNMTSINIPNSVTNIERNAFMNYTSLTSVNIPTA